ncbi:site-specific integrase [Temperatibacter marinus]|uniref:Site-specific integrase n=1 Tax=Temperatibacter marinus TaxID=1456591 RepID=A0AA52EFM5_9PROT|nr:site-specific integrase [Temperatibacter marinus]WND03901.1 site-specific integrase [Temperatibacter marinus]
MKQAAVLTDTQFKRTLKIIATGRHAERNRIIVLLSHWSGMRVGEISQLLVKDLLNQDGTVVDQLQINPAYTKGHVTRRIFIGTKLRAELTRYIKWLATDKEVNLVLNQPLIQSQKSQKPFSQNSLSLLFKRLYIASGVPTASSHSGRRHYISKLAHSGVSAKVIMELAGHKHLTTTQRYIDVTDQMKASAVELL